jgi:adenosylcobinamide amidohydrolase
MTRPEDNHSTALPPIEKGRALFDNDNLRVDRIERRIVAVFKRPHRVLSTSIIGGGLREDCSHVMNQQSCEPRAHDAAMGRWREHGAEGSHRLACEDAGLEPATTALCSTAANMSCAGVAVETYQELSVCCIATAGVEGNATRAGDPAAWHETPEGCSQVSGTIVHLVFINQPCSEGCLVKAATMLTEAKSCAVLDLRAPSLQGSGLATGTGTDQCALCAPLAQGDEWERRFAGSHNSLGMILCRAVHRATSRALELQNGLVPSMRRSIEIALKRHGFDFERLVALAGEHGGHDFADFLHKNKLPLLFDPRSGGCAHALAEVLDLAAVGILEASTRDELLLDQAALLACAVTNDRNRFTDYRQRLLALGEVGVMDLVHHACCWGFHEKWPELGVRG